MMINPAHTLAFSIQSNPGGYAFLLGSGISTAAGILTGWEILLDLIRKLATIQGEICEPGNEEVWYQDKYKKDANYSDLIHELARTQAERQQLIRPYIEPNEEERERGEKLPTAAHRSVAELIAQGFIRIIITTNFDRLIETALIDKGIEPTVLSSVDQIKGSLPLHRMSSCCIIKLHGDYLDPVHIRNTLSELDEYPDEINRLLDRVFDEYGLVVCGWSAEWDVALRDAMFRNNSRRFTTYWTVRNEKSDQGQRMITHTQAAEIFIQDADSFFQDLHHQIEAINEFSKPHPLSAKIALASLKRYLSESRYRIHFNDLVDKEVTRILDITSRDDFSVHDEVTQETVTKRIQRYESACSTLMKMAVIGGFWVEDEHYSVWEQALRYLASRRSKNGIVEWLDLQIYPATLLLYALGIGALETEKPERLQFLGRLFTAKIFQDIDRDLTSIQRLPPSLLSTLSSVGNIVRFLNLR